MGEAGVAGVAGESTEITAGMAAPTSTRRLPASLSALADCNCKWNATAFPSKQNTKSGAGKGLREQSRKYMEYGRNGDADICTHRQNWS